jgi:hypothetical protein
LCELVVKGTNTGQLPKGIFAMLISVVYENGRQDMVKPYVLDRLIDKQEITSFRRSSGWVVLGRDPIRASQRKIYCIPERRETEFTLNG